MHLLAVTSVVGIAAIAALGWAACMVQLLRLVSARAALAKVRHDASVDPETGLIAGGQFHERIVAERRRISRMGGGAHVQVMRFANADLTRTAGTTFREQLQFPSCGFRLDDVTIAVVTLAADSRQAHVAIPQFVSNAAFDINQDIDEQSLGTMISAALEQLA